MSHPKPYGVHYIIIDAKGIHVETVWFKLEKDRNKFYDKVEAKNPTTLEKKFRG